MSTTTRLSIELPTELAITVRERVAQGDYSSESEVFADALFALEVREQTIDEWLRGPVMDSYNKLVNDPETGLTSAQVLEHLRAQRSQ